jgi:ABC-type uncharacterized transport system substrate-binding protein
MIRREFISLFGGAAAWPIAARGQQNSMPVVGFLNPRTRSKGTAVAAAFRQGLRDAGYDEGHNVAVEYRWAEDHMDRLPALAADLVERRVAVIVAGGGARFAAAAATSSIPVVFTTGLDPVSAGIVKTLNRPEANLTGVSFYSGGALIAKQIDLLRALVPNFKTLAMVVYPASPSAQLQLRDAEAAAPMNGVGLRVVPVADAAALEPAFASIQADAALVAVDPFFDSRPGEVVVSATRRRVPTMYYVREFVEAGGLVSYGASINDAYRQAGLYAGRILAGAQPSDLPVVLPTRFELVINLRAAKALGLTVPDNLLALADEVIE